MNTEARNFFINLQKGGKFSAAQLEQINLALEHGIPIEKVQAFADPSRSEGSMFAIRFVLESFSTRRDPAVVSAAELSNRQDITAAEAIALIDSVDSIFVDNTAARWTRAQSYKSWDGKDIDGRTQVIDGPDGQPITTAAALQQASIAINNGVPTQQVEKCLQDKLSAYQIELVWRAYTYPSQEKLYPIISKEAYTPQQLIELKRANATDISPAALALVAAFVPDTTKMRAMTTGMQVLQDSPAVRAFGQDASNDQIYLFGSEEAPVLAGPPIYLLQALFSPQMNAKQVSEIWQGLAQGLSIDQVKAYASPDIPAEKMATLREDLVSKYNPTATPTQPSATLEQSETIGISAQSAIKDAALASDSREEVPTFDTSIHPTHSPMER